jgi:CheY-like chemotaxis protein
MSINQVLIVDDSEIDQYLAKYLIESFNITIDILQAYDGQEALEILSTLPQPPSVIFLDINMPRMNGHEFLEKYEADGQVNTTVIMLSSSEAETDKEKSLAYACVKKFVTKPISKTELERLLS